MSRYWGIDGQRQPALGGGMPGESLVGMDELLDRFRQSTDTRASDELLQRLHSRIAAEPRSTAPRRFVAALRALHGPGMWRGFVQSTGAAFGPGTRSMRLRIQALAVVLVVIGTTGAGSVAAIAAAARVVTEVRGPAISEQRPAHHQSPSRPSGAATQVDAARNHAADERPDTSEAKAAGQRAGLPDPEEGTDPSAPRVKTDAPGNAANAPANAPNENANEKASQKARSAPNGNAQGKTESLAKSVKSATAPNPRSGEKANDKANEKASQKARSAPNGNAQGKTESLAKSVSAPDDTAQADTDAPGTSAATPDENAQASTDAPGKSATTPEGQANGQADEHANEKARSAPNGRPD